MKRPRPGPATSAAIVAVAQICTRASRTPVKITGMANGSSILPKIWVPFMPRPRDASTMSRSTSRIPTYAFVMIGGNANSTRAIKVARPARPYGPKGLAPTGPRESTSSTAKTGTAPPVVAEVEGDGKPDQHRHEQAGDREQQLLHEEGTDPVGPGPVRPVGQV